MKHLLGTTAVAATLLFALPAFAQQSPYDQNPTPQERQQTNQLNSDAQQDAAAPVAPMAPSANDADYAAKKADYDQKMRDYNQQRDAYDREHARYQAERAGYVHHWEVFYGYRDFRDVDAMRSDELVGLRVDARDGVHIGHVRDVDTNADGRVVRVSVSIGDGRRAWIDADDLRFNPGERVVFTDLSRDQVDDMARMRVPRY